MRSRRAWKLKGRAAELLDGGEEMVAIDRFNSPRRPRPRRDAADQVVVAASPGAAGGVRGRCQPRAAGARPWELRLLRLRPEPWTAADRVVMGRLIGYVGLAQAQGEVGRWIVQMLAAGVSAQTLDELFGGRVAGFDQSLRRA